MFSDRLLGSFNVCTEGTDEIYQKTIAALDAIVELSVKLSTTLIGLGAALLIGLKTGLRFTPVTKLITITAVLFFAQSALYAVLWRLGVAELWLNKCLELVSQDILTRPYQAHFGFFLAGLLALGALVVIAAFGVRESGSGEST